MTNNGTQAAQVAEVAVVTMTQARPAAAQPAFEPLDLGEGGLGIKLVRLKSMRASAKISQEHFDWALKRLLRVRAFGCPGDHQLERSATHLDGWTCNVCDTPLPLKTTVFSCRDCDWDGCCDCLNEAKRTASAEVKYDWWGDEEEPEGPDTVLVEKVSFECAKKCVLQKSRTTSDQYQCNLCAQRLPHKALIYSCRTCDFDGCGLCFSRLKAQSSENNENKVESSTEEKEIDLKCPAQHLVREYCTPDADWACDLCKLQQPQAAFMLGCRECNWDVCVVCANESTTLPAAIKPHAVSTEREI